MTNREYFMQRWEAEFPAFVRVLKALPKDKLDYRPHPRSRTAAELVWLLVLEVQGFIELIDKGKIDWKEVPPTMGLDEMVAAFEKAHAALAPRLKNVDDQRWEQKKVQLVVEGTAVLDEPMYEMFWVTLFDAVHHRGQLSTYLRPMGGKVPSIYGPSADDAGG